MKYLRCAIAVLLVSCGVGDPYAQWRIQQPKYYVQTPNGHVRDGGPFRSVKEGWVTEKDLDWAVDSSYLYYSKLFPDYPAPNYAVWLVDDYVMWVDGAGWAGGVSYMGAGWIGVCIWSRVYTDTDPHPCFIARAPGNSFGTQYSAWRHTDLPLMPAIAHELLHTVIDDPQHKSPLWQRFNVNSKLTGEGWGYECSNGLGP